MDISFWLAWVVQQPGGLSLEWLLGIGFTMGLLVIGHAVAWGVLKTRIDARLDRLEDELKGGVLGERLGRAERDIESLREWRHSRETQKTTLALSEAVEAIRAREAELKRERGGGE